MPRVWRGRHADDVMKDSGTYDCRTSVLEATAEAAGYVARYRDAERFLELCRECPNFGRSWACPPFDIDMDEVLRAYSTVTFHAVRIEPLAKNLPVSAARDVMRPHRMEFERRLLDIECNEGGRVFTFAGECLHCSAGTCTRPYGKPCRHPERVRPSLEAWGFDVSRTVKDFLGLDLLWGADGSLPEYLMLVGAHFR